MSESRAPIGWFDPPVGGGGGGEQAAPGDLLGTADALPARSGRRLREIESSTKVTLGLVVISGLVILGGANDLVGPNFWAGSSAGSGALDAIRDVIGIGLIMLGVGLFTRREIARQIYFLLAALGYLAILADAGSATPAVTLIALVLQTLPIVFLTRRAVSATFR